MAIISDFDSEDPGSIPGAASFFFFFFLLSQKVQPSFYPRHLNCLIYLATKLADSFFARSAEVEGDLYETCAVSEYPDYRVYMPFLYCMSLSYRTIPLNVRSCAITHGLDYDVLTVRTHDGST